MISFRKHAAENTRRPNSFLGRRRAAESAKSFALLTFILLAASAGGAASPRVQKQDQAGAKGAEPAAGSPAPEGVGGEEAKIPIRVTRVEMPDGPGVLATIGEFPSDLNEAGQEFLKREFFESFASDVLGLGDPEMSARATLKVAMLPQEKENQREGDFTFGKLSGHMVVLVEKRRVLVACTFSEVGRKPQLLASVSGFWAGVRAE
ncbi:MAG: hypothetical protein LC795_22890 [Acidobacteria bacterium]|nr:hypothetical protein [Acidobacteriota bacterium]